MDKKKILLERLKLCDKATDKEAAHLVADGALLKYINDPEITEAFEDLIKWYA